VLLRARGVRALRPGECAEAALSPELAAALSERPDPPLIVLWRMLREDGLLAPLATVAAMALASCVLMIEALLFRGVFDVAPYLNLPPQRLAAALALMVFAGVLIVLETPIVLESLRMGRTLEARFRMALLRKLPRLNDRYFQSRPITDMADRSHNIHLLRNVPAMGLQLVQAVMELALTFAGVAVIDPADAWLAAALVGIAAALPFLIQPVLAERDLRVRTHAAALHGFYLDALLGLAPVRAHRAERAVARQHEGLLVEWARSLRGSIRLALSSDAAQAVLCTSIGGGLLVSHFLRAGQVTGSDLLLAFWVLKLPAIGARLASLAHQYPAQRNVLLRLMEPLSAPETLNPPAAQTTPPVQPDGPVGIRLRDASVLAGGHEVLRKVDLNIAPREHVAMVGVSGAGKSSLLGVLLGWHRLAEGELAFDGLTADAEALAALRARCAWVDPGVQIWNRSLLDNLAYASDAAPLDRIGEVVETAGLRGVAEKLPRGLQTVVGEGGGLLSGGEGQRVRLGRALCVENPRLALLDEPFRGLDRDQRRALLANARDWWRDTTLICVTHDVGETRDFPRVLVVEDGRIVEDGPPAALSARPSRYRELLQAEEEIRRLLWRDDGWRRLRVEAGRLAPAETAQ
jgi:ATP-binding cassette subfamily B protein